MIGEVKTFILYFIGLKLFEVYDVNEWGCLNYVGDDGVDILFILFKCFRNYDRNNLFYY